MQDRVVVITGASAGIGSALAEWLGAQRMVSAYYRARAMALAELQPPFMRPGTGRPRA